MSGCVVTLRRVTGFSTDKGYIHWNIVIINILYYYAEDLVEFLMDRMIYVLSITERQEVEEVEEELRPVYDERELTELVSGLTLFLEYKHTLVA
ncbi:hypothetical protein WN51_08324 [Melipona quadrifasciata]|uniref:Uncharacterized protein n=1 Tax=Melipona quadrifasciata TaxID=166423 RepID=A0A0N0BK88_9HYME|nr:hypothetical protein WN51_08324 [Melipona quadrifasciata]